MSVRTEQRLPAVLQPGDALRTALFAVLGVILLSDSLTLAQRANGSQPHLAAVGRVSSGSHAARGSRPAGLRIPRIGVSSGLSSIHIGARGELQAPTDYFTPGWWSEGVQPGATGPAVIVGHVDSLTKPAVFYRLRQLRPTDTILIPRHDGTTAVFVVDALREFSKSQFPTKLVYGRTKGSTLRLITCGGRFDSRSGHYADNVVVFAHLTKVQPRSSEKKRTINKTTPRTTAPHEIHPMMGAR